MQCHEALPIRGNVNSHCRSFFIRAIYFHKRIFFIFRIHRCLFLVIGA